jgi:hypothetical protein
VHETGRLDGALRGRPFAIAITKPQLLTVAARASDDREHGCVYGGAGIRERHDERVQRLDAAAQTRRQDLLELRERTHRGLFHPSDGASRRGSQADRHRKRLVVVEEQRRKRRACAEPVAARHPRGRMDRVAEAPKPVDIAPERAPGDLEPLREVGA